ncbi:regulator of chromosome condensation 1/beta-lactamase-inhibitor protein II [Sporodiniella umbellata]|nr:regulator of chromosome condensation 1/beta-lactamase-inhibitor protein II [Sporodiniella umbellata]
MPPKRQTKSEPESLRKRSRTDKPTKWKTRHVLNKVATRPSIAGQLFVCGTNDFGQLGMDGDEKNRPVPIKSVSNIEFVDIVAGGLHSLALTKKGDLYSWGCTDEGVLGREGANDTPIKLGTTEKFVKITSGDCINMALTASGDLYTWGTYRGAEGKFGFSQSVMQQNLPLLYDSLVKETIVDIAVGTNHSLALNAGGRLFSWGYGEQGQLGRRISPRYPKDSLRCELVGLKNVKLIGAGSYHSLAVTHDNQLFAWGLNNFRQCADTDDNVIIQPTRIDISVGNIAYVSGGEHFSIVVNEEGQVYTFGRGDANQLGLSQNIMAPLKLSSSESAFKFVIPMPTLVDGLPPVSQVSVGSEFVLTSCTNGQGYSWGFNSSNAIGNGSDEDEPVPYLLKGKNLGTNHIVRVAAGGQHSVFLTKPSE